MDPGVPKMPLMLPPGAASRARTEEEYTETEEGEGVNGDVEVGKMASTTVRRTPAEETSSPFLSTVYKALLVDPPLSRRAPTLYTTSLRSSFFRRRSLLYV